MAEAALARVILCPGAVELLDELTGGARTLTELRRVVPRRALEPALRVLATEGALRRSQAGTWDGRPGGGSVFALTATGHRIVGCLSDLDVRVAVYDDYLDGDRAVVAAVAHLDGAAAGSGRAGVGVGCHGELPG